MMTRKTRLFPSLGLMLAATLVLAGCGSSSEPQTVTLEKLGITLDLPANWTYAEEVSDVRGLLAELRHDGRRTMTIMPDDEVIDNFEAMKSALAAGSNVTITDEETFDNGFGFRYTEHDDELFLYHIKVGDRTYQFTANRYYYDPEDIPAAIGIAKSARPAGS